MRASTRTGAATFVCVFSGRVSRKGVETFSKDVELYGEDKETTLMVQAKLAKEAAAKAKAEEEAAAKGRFAADEGLLSAACLRFSFFFLALACTRVCVCVCMFEMIASKRGGG